MKKLLFFSLLITCALRMQAQPAFHSLVRIEFEKTVYVRQLFKSIQPEWYDRIKDQLPEKSLSYFNFTGDTAHSIYAPGRETPDEMRNFGINAGKNTVYNDYREGRTVTQKPAFEEVFLLQDSLLPIQWRLTADTRVIAGYECRKAVGIVNDTLALFAFYTDEILVRGGPEGAQGLPGMILGLGMPRIHTTWFATRVEVSGINTREITPATKGKKVGRKALMQALENALKNWGNYGRNYLLNFII